MPTDKFSEIRIGVCVTIFNEPFSYLEKTFNGLIDELERVSNLYDLKVFVVLIFDGVEFIDSTMKTFIELHRGYVDNKNNGCDWISISAVDIHSGEVTLKARMDSLAVTDNKVRECLSGEQQCSLFCIFKRHNKGKLNSHAWFYDHICKIILPDYCLQIDVGTYPDKYSIENLLFKLQLDGTIGGIAAVPLIEISSIKMSYLECYQYYSLLMERKVLWWIEDSLGFLSVLPGQMSMIRYRSLLEPVRGANLNENVPSNETVLTSYLREAKKNEFFSKVKYLAEDRLICIKLFYHTNRLWKLRLSPESTATTDGCNSWNELLRQRRRWTVGAFACRLSIIRESCLCIRTSCISSTHQTVDILRFCYFTFLLVYEVVKPVLIIVAHFSIAFYAIEKSIAISIYVSIPIISLNVLCYFLLIFTILILILSNRLLVYEMYLNISVSITMITFFLNVVLSGLTQYLVVTVIASCAFVLLITCLESSSGKFDRKTTFVISFVRYLSIKFTIDLYISIYSLAHFADLSWGTKGLVEKSRCMLCRLVNSVLIFSVFIFSYKVCLVLYDLL